MAILKTKTRYGLVEGQFSGNQRISVFKGVPYAAPPVGPLRFLPPQPLQPWDGVRRCHDFAPVAVQDTYPIGLPFGDFFIKEFYPLNHAMSEDCLYLNIWTSADSTEDKQPVMMWIHGGGLSSGYSYEMEFDGDAIAKRGVILVTVGYRLNYFGFFAHPDLTARSEYQTSGNNTLLDHVAAMSWLRENIAAFGGDPDNILIFGQSGGAAAVMAHLTSPVSRSWFDKAIIQSGPNAVDNTPAFLKRSLADIENWGVSFCQLTGKTLQDLYDMSADQLFSAFRQATGKIPGIAPLESVDGWFLPERPVTSASQGRLADVPILAGNVGGDAIHFPGFEQDLRAWQEKVAEEKLGPTLTKKLLARFPADHPENAALYQSLIDCQDFLASLAFGEALTRHGRRNPYLYYINPYVPGGDEFNFVGDGASYHSFELWFVFGTLDRCWRRFDGRYYDLMNQILDYWTNFAKTGDPNTKGRPLWTPYDRQTRCIQVMNETGTQSRSMSKNEVSQILNTIFED